MITMKKIILPITLFCVISFVFAIDTSQSWHPVQQIATDSSGNTGVDVDLDGVIDGSRNIDCLGSNSCIVFANYVTGNTAPFTISNSGVNDIQLVLFNNPYTAFLTLDRVTHNAEIGVGDTSGTVNENVLTLTNAGNVAVDNDFSTGGDIAATGGIYGATIVSSGTITANTVNTGQGDYELYNMNQDVTTSSSPTFQTITLTSDPYCKSTGSGCAPATKIQTLSTDPVSPADGEIWLII